MDPGTRIGPYEIVEPLGKGGMGEVYLAEDSRLGRKAAVKVAGPDDAADEERHRRLVEEARHASSLNHPHICTIYDVGEEGGRTWIGMEYVEGTTLQELARGAGLDAERVRRFGLQLADALAYAHRHGVVHRDLKSANVMVTPEERLKILDFGLALRIEETDLEDVATSRRTLTSGDRIAGTLPYLAPEVLAGARADAGGDIWSLGVVLLEAATGELPFRGRTGFEVTSAILKEDPDGLERLPAGLRTVVGRCLEKDPERRYREVAEVGADLRALIVGGATGREGELTDTDSPTAVFEAPRTREPLRGARRWLGLGVVVVLLLAGIAALGTWISLPGSTEPAAGSGGGEGVAAPVAAVTRVAVLPFSYRGSPDFEYLGEGLADLLVTKLDGAGDLRAVDPRAIRGLLVETAGESTDLAASRDVGRRLGADLVVLGDVIEVDERLTIGSTIYRVEDGEARERASVSGAVSGLFDLVDELAIRLLASRTEGTRTGTFGIAAVTTDSLPALRGYLEGESLIRQGRFTEAVGSLQAAVSEDPEFAVAHYRLSVAAEWAGRPELAFRAAEAAERHSERLSERHRLLLEAFLAFRRGAADEAERRYRALVGSYPTDLEAWSQLGEVLFHHNPMRGRPIEASREAFERVLELEPDHVPSILHLARLAAAEGDLQELEEGVRRVRQIQPEGERALEVAALQAFTEGDRAAQNEVLEQMRGAQDATLMVSLWATPTFSGNLADSERLLEVATAPARAAETRALAHVLRAHVRLAQGKLAAAEEDLAAAERFRPAEGLVNRALWSVLPFLPEREAEMEEALEDLEAWDAERAPPSATPLNWTTVHDGVYGELRDYLLGLLGARSENPGEVRERAEALERASAPAELGTTFQDLALSLRAQQALAEGRTADALSALEGRRMEIWYNRMFASAFFAQGYERFLQAGLLAGAGRYEDALHGYGSFEHHSPQDLIYAAPAHLRSAEIHRRRGDVEQAAFHYGRFVELWKDADPELQPRVEKARAALASLTGGAGDERS